MSFEWICSKFFQVSTFNLYEYELLFPRQKDILCDWAEIYYYIKCDYGRCYGDDLC